MMLREINKSNFYDVIKLQVNENQQHFVAANLFSLAQAWLYKDNARPFAIYAEDGLVGFCMMSIAPKDDGTTEYDIWRFMIDKNFQGKGYGKAALKEAIAFLKKEGAKEISLSYEPENHVAAALYASEGFVPTGEMHDGEAVAKLTL